MDKENWYSSQMSPYTKDYFRYLWQLLNGFRSNGEREIFLRRERDIAPYLNGKVRLRILDLANGPLRPQYTILRSAGHQVYGIDRANRPELSLARISYILARALYSWKLGSVSKNSQAHALICGDVGALPFNAASFDLITSVAAFEHFLDVGGVVSEIHRVLRPGGLAWIGIHLFTCPSGGHNLSFTEIPLRTVPKGVDPWDHLRKRHLPFHVPLNEWRRDQYFDLFSRHFEILNHYCAMREGEEFLTPVIEAELANYRRDELTCGAYVILARKSS
jgi:SAM-dependent methyltransferase